MTTSDRMTNFKRMVERFAKEGKLLTAEEKAAVLPIQWQLVDFEANQSRFPRIQLVLRPEKKRALA